MSDGNSRCRLGRQDTRRSRVSCRAQSASRVTVRHGMNVLDSISYIPIDWQHFKWDIPHCWSFVRAVHWAPVGPPHKESVGWCLDVFSLLFFLYLSTQAVEQTVKLVVNLNAVMLKWCYFNFQCIMHCLRYTLTRDLHLNELSLVQVVTDADLLISHHMEMDQWWFIMCNIKQWQ